MFTFVMEIRPRLQSCNVFLILKQDLGEKIQVKLKENEIEISTKDITNIIKVSSFSILVDSLSCLQASSSFVSFRFQTQNVNKIAGQFKSEVLILDSNDKTESLINKVMLNNNTTYIIKCVNCQNDISNEINFQRILPLPSENVQPGDWFCHKSEDGTTLRLSPNLNDCFYANCYVHINKNILINYRLSTNQVVICKRCFSWLGLQLKSDTIQFWFNTVTFLSKENSLFSNPLNDFILTTKSEINEILVGACKVLFETRNQNNNSEYLCVWILEKKLKISIKDDKNNDKFNGEIINVAKVLFHFDSQITNTISEWLNDANISHIKISKPMMVHGLNHLYEMCGLIPIYFRKSNNFYVSYIVI